MIKNKTVCIVSEFPPPYGGIAQQAMLLKNLLQANGIRVITVATNLQTHGGFALIAKIPYIKSIVTVIIFLANFIEKINKTSIVHILSSSYLNFFLFSYPTVLLSIIFKKPVVLHYHGGAAGKFLERAGFFAKFPIRLANKLIVPSEFLLKVFRKHGLNPDIIPNIVDLKLFNFKPREIYRPIFLITRHLEESYNIACTIKAFAIIKSEIPDAKLYILGDGSERKALEQLTKDLNCENAITFYGAVPNNKISQFYYRADIMLNSSLIDNMPMAILEAFSSGCVVISTKAGGIPFMIENRKNGLLVELNDYNALAQSSIWLIKHQEEARQMAHNAYQKLEDFSAEKIILSLVDLYTQFTE